MGRAKHRIGLFRGWIPIAALAAAAALLAAGIGAAYYAEQSYKEQKIREIAAQARILASTATAAVAFRDRQAAEEYVNALSANPEVRAAAIYESGGALLAGYSRAGTELPSRPEPSDATFRDDRLVVTAPIILDREPIGIVYLQTITEPFERRLLRYAGIGLLATMAALVIAVLGSAHAALARANEELGLQAAELQDANDKLQEQIVHRERAEAELRQAQKMETIGQLTGGVAHDFNNLLTIILGNLDRLKRRLEDGAEASQLIQAVANATRGAERAASLTRSLLAFSRRQPLDPKPVDLNKLVTGMSDLLRRSLGEKITIETVISGGLWPTLVDPNQLENAILNLAVNARDAMPDGGKLTIETANAHLDTAYAAAQAEVAAGQYVAIFVSDTGCGMSKDVMEQVFEPFFTTKDAGHGTGLGLSQVYGFVKQSGGHVKIYSEVGQGTTVKIYLPRLLSEEPLDLPAPISVPVPRARRDEAILVVEDEEEVRRNSTEMLRELGYQVFEASAGAEALQILERHSGIALLFTDVGLPGGMNGRQLADEAERRWPGLKVLFTTGYARNAIVHEGKLDRGVRLITKPFSFGDLSAAVRELLDRRLDAPCALIVEDEFLVRMNAVEDLKEMGLRVVEAATAQEAMNVARAADGGLDVAIVDFGLPDRQGDSLVAELRAAYAKLPVIIASGRAEADLRERFSADPLVRVVAKPYQARHLATALRAAGIPIAR